MIAVFFKISLRFAELSATFPLQTLIYLEYLMIKRTVLVLSWLILPFLLMNCDGTGSKEPQKENLSIWVMPDEASPDYDVKFWLSQKGDHASCDSKPYTKALALAEFLFRKNEVDDHERHDHLVRHPNGGYAVLEYNVLEDEEVPLYKFSRMHYHGIYVDVESAAEMMSTLTRHQHMTKKEFFGDLSR